MFLYLIQFLNIENSLLKWSEVKIVEEHDKSQIILYI